MPAKAGTLLNEVGIEIGRYGLVAILLLIGGLKFTHAEAMAIEPLVSHSPLLFWLYSVTSVDGVSQIIGTTEVGVALLIALRPISAVASAAGSLLAVATFLTTLSFMLSTPGVWDPAFPELSSTGSFLVKDLCLLACAVFTAGEALATVSKGSIK